jgi:hypothetical protein
MGAVGILLLGAGAWLCYAAYKNADPDPLTLLRSQLKTPTATTPTSVAANG